MCDMVYDHKDKILNEIKKEINEFEYLNLTVVNNQFTTEIKDIINSLEKNSLIDEIIISDVDIIITTENKQKYVKLVFNPFQFKYVFVDIKNKYYEPNEVQEIEELGFLAILDLLRKINKYLKEIKYSFIDYANKEYSKLMDD